MNNKIKIIVAEQEILFRDAISICLKRNVDFEIMHTVSNSEELLCYLQDSTILPDIVIIDIIMPTINGITSTKLIKTAFPNIRLIVLTSHYTTLYLVNMIAAGASAFLTKNITPEVLSETIKEVHRKGFYYGKELLKKMNQANLLYNKKLKSQFDSELTNRELEILKLICQQFSTTEIAEKLNLSLRTIEGHKNNLLQKTTSKNVVSLVMYAIQNDYIGLEEIL